MKKLWMAILFLCSVLASANDANVILITFDGVRTQEFFNGFDHSVFKGRKGQLFSKVWSEFAAEGLVLGNPGASSQMQVDNPVAVSLPGYQNIMAGRATGCMNNSCSRITVVIESQLKPCQSDSSASLD